MPSEGAPSPSPGPGASLEESLKYYKAQYEFLESELADFQASSKDLEAELEKDIEAAEKRERSLKEQANNLRYEVDEWKEKHKQAKTEAGAAQAALEREIKDLRGENLTLRQKVRDIEVANDDYERKQRNTEVSLEDMESKYNQTIERSVMLEEEVRTGEQEREALRIEAQRLKDELSDLKIEAEITKKKLEKAEEGFSQRRTPLRLDPAHSLLSPRSELSPTATDASGPSLDTPPNKTTSTTGISDTPTPPSPPISEKSGHAPQPFTTPNIVKKRTSVHINSVTPRQTTTTTRPNGHAPGSSVTAFNRAQPSSAYRQSLSKQPASVSRATAGLPQSSSIIHLRNLRGKMQQLEQRVQTARSKLPAPVNTPPKASPRNGSALGNHIPSSVTVRSRKRNGGSTINGPDSLPDDASDTPSRPRSRPSRQSLNQRPTSPVRPSMAAPPRPASRVSGVSSRTGQYQPGHSRPTSRASISGLRGIAGPNFAPNASTDRVRPHSSLSNRSGYDGALDEDLDEHPDQASATPRRSTYTKRTSDVGSAIPTPTANKRSSIGGATKFPGLGRRQSAGLIRPPSSSGEARSHSRQSSVLGGVEEGEAYDLHETF